MSQPLGERAPTSPPQGLHRECQQHVSLLQASCGQPHPATTVSLRWAAGCSPQPHTGAGIGTLAFAQVHQVAECSASPGLRFIPVSFPHPPTSFAHSRAPCHPSPPPFPGGGASSGFHAAPGQQGPGAGGREAEGSGWLGKESLRGAAFTSPFPPPSSATRPRKQRPEPELLSGSPPGTAASHCAREGLSCGTRALWTWMEEKGTEVGL